MTDTIQRALVVLVDQEQDYKTKKKHPASWYRREVAGRLELVDKDNPSTRTYEGYLKSIRDNFRQRSPIDELWTIGASIEHDIPGDIIPLLVFVQSRMNDVTKDDPEFDERLKKDLQEYARVSGGKYLGGEIGITIRHAKWFSKLYPLIQKIASENGEETDLTKITSDDTHSIISAAFGIAVVYSRFQFGHEILKSKTFDSSSLDEYFFINRDFFKLAPLYRASLLFFVSLSIDVKYFKIFNDLCKSNKDGEQ